MAGGSVDVAVVGGGPAGLSAALALAAVMPQARVALYERSPPIETLPARGAGLGVTINGQRALRGISPAAYNTIVTQHAVTFDKSETRSQTGEVIRSMDMTPMMEGQKAKYGGMTFIQTGWQELVQVLTDAAKEAGVEIMSSHKFLAYKEEGDGGLCLSFDTGTYKPSEVTAQLVVGADGFFSRVRQQCVGDGAPEAGGTLYWRARVPGSLAAQFGYVPGKIVSYAGGGTIGLVFTVGPHADVVWTLGCPEALLKEAGVEVKEALAGRLDASAMSSDYLQRSRANGEAALQRILAVFADYDPALVGLVKATDPAAIVEHGLFTRPGEQCTPAWFGSGRVVVVGDASHPLRPTGQGTNMALEDAYELGRCIAQAGGRASDEALTSFRERRAARVGPVSVFVAQQGQAAYRQDAREAATATQRAMTDQEHQAFLDGETFEPPLRELLVAAGVEA